MSWILDNFLASAVLIIIVLFQADIRRALARVGGGVFPRMAERQESQVLEEVVRAAQTLAQRRVGALVVFERETRLEDLIQIGTPLDAAVTKDLLVSIFLPYSPLHDGAVVIQSGRIAFAGCILPLTLRADLPEGLGTRHRAALGITEETDAVVIVVSEETASISRRPRRRDGARPRRARACAASCATSSPAAGARRRTPRARSKSSRRRPRRPGRPPTRARAPGA